MRIGSMCNNINFGGIVILKTKSEQNKEGIHLSNVKDNYTKNLTKKYDLVDTFCKDVKQNSKEENFVKEFLEKLDVPLESIGNIKSLYNIDNSVKVIGEKGIVFALSEKCPTTKQLRQILRFKE